MSKDKRWAGQTDEAHPDVFVTVPPQPAQLKPGQLTAQQVKQFFDEGYVCIEDFFDKENDLDPIKNNINDIVDQLAEKLFAAGKIKNLYKDHGIYDRLTMIDKEFPGANIILLKLGALPKAVRKLWSNPRLLNIMEQLIGSSDIMGHPVWNLRTKTPNNEATTVPWHQGVGYFDNRSYTVLQPIAWIPLLDADEINGCMQMVKRGHRSGKVATHQCCSGDTWYIMLAEDEMERSLGVDMQKDVVTCPVKYGSMLLFNNLIPHRSLNNRSSMIRWSLDLRWQRADLPVGFYDLKQGVLMRSSKDPNLKINWDPFDNVSRHDESIKFCGKEGEDEFDTTLIGPWMKKWEIVHANRHTESMTKNEASLPL